MSADNFVVARRFKDGWYYADLGASYWWVSKEIYPDSEFRTGPFPTEEAALTAAFNDGYVEYGAEPDNKPEDAPVTEHPHAKDRIKGCRQMFKGVGIDRHPNYAIVVHSLEHGSGVYSWHISKEEALHNNRIVRGIVVPVRYRADGEMITPPLATAYVMKHIGGTSFIP